MPLMTGVKVTNIKAIPGTKDAFCDLYMPDPPVTRESIQALIDAQLNLGDFVRMGAGRIEIPAPLLIDYSAASFDSPRLSLVGAGSSSTVLASAVVGDYALKVFGGTREGQVNKATYSDFQIIRGADGALGMSIVDTANFKLQNVTLYGLDVGLYLEAVQISTFENVHCMFGATIGVKLVEPDAFVTPFDSLNFNQCGLQGGRWGMQGGQLANLCLFQTRVEGSGLAAASTGPEGTSSGVVGHGGLDLHFGSIPGTSHFALDYGPGLNMAYGWVENNCGEADIILTNDGVSTITHNIVGVPFTRVGAKNWCTNFIKVRNPNGGKTILRLDGCAFAGFNDYVPSEDRLYVDADANTKVEPRGCAFASDIERGSLRNL